MAGLVLLPMLFALVFASRGFLSGDPVPFLVLRYDQLVWALATPIIALLLGTSAFSAESDDGTLLYLVTTTTPRWWIVLVRVLFAMAGHRRWRRRSPCSAPGSLPPARTIRST